MFKLTIVLCFSFLCSTLLARASPVAASLGAAKLLLFSDLASRDVISPHITSPDANTVWVVGDRATVTWDTSNFPPDSQITNPIGKVVLGHLGPTGGLNLDIDHPLAQNFKLRDGKVQITVPSVPPREDYIIVLFGDSGNTSPAFAITRIRGGSSSSSSGTATVPGSTTPTGSTSAASSSQPTATRSASSSSSTLITEPIPITGSTITGGESSAVPSASDSISASVSSALSSALSASTTSAAPASTTSTSAALAARPSGCLALLLGLASVLSALV